MGGKKAPAEKLLNGLVRALDAGFAASPSYFRDNSAVLRSTVRPHLLRLLLHAVREVPVFETMGAALEAEVEFAFVRGHLSSGGAKGCSYLTRIKDKAPWHGGDDNLELADPTPVRHVGGLWCLSSAS
jgi:hypothetical protein